MDPHATLLRRVAARKRKLAVDEAQAIHAARRAGKSLRWIAREVGLSHEQVRRTLRRS